MKNILKIISFLGLALIIFPPILYLASVIGKPSMTWIMTIGTIAWFATVPFWMGKKA